MVFKIMLFGGTTEGRLLAEFCMANHIPVCVSVTTDFGANLLPEQTDVLIGKRNMAEMRDILVQKQITHVIDATHPFAVEATQNIRSTCEQLHLPYIRLKRECADISGKVFYDISSLLDDLNKSDEVILSTLGSKLLPALSTVRNAGKRLWVRVLPTQNISEYCENLGIPVSHVLAEKPPFSVEKNLEHIRKSGAALLVTKESGKTGGYPEKCEAAQLSGIKLLTLCRPEDAGASLEEVKNWLKEAVSSAY